MAYLARHFTKRQKFALSKLKEFAEDISNVAQMMISAFNRKKKKTLDTSIFCFYHDVFKRLFCLGS